MSVPISGEARGMGNFRGADRVEFSWLGQAWTLLWARPGVWITAFLIYSLITLVLWLLWAIPSGMVAAFQQVYLTAVYHTTSPPRPVHPYQDFALGQVFGLVLAGTTSIFYGGLYRMALRQMRGETISAAGLFSGFPSALPLLMVGIVVPVILAPLEVVLVWLLHRTLSVSAAITISSNVFIFPSLVLDALLMFAPLLVVDSGATAVEAMLGSVRLLRGQWVMGIVFYLVASLLSVVGALACGVGMLVTLPWFLLSIAVGYFALTQPVSTALPEMPSPDPSVWPPPPRIS